MTASSPQAPHAVPLTVLTGFLGAGKTTLLNRILTGDHGLRVAVLVNDFGSINIDAELVVGVESDGDIINLANGCVCCNIRDDLAAAVMQMTTRPERPEYILLEASGVADPSGIALTFMDDGMRDRIRLDSIMCVVDAEQVFANPEVMELKVRQMAFADMIILTKVDLVDRAQVERIKEWLDSRFHRYRLVETRHGDVPLEVLVAVGRFDPSKTEPNACLEHAHCTHPASDHQHAEHDHSRAFSTWSYETDQPLLLEALRETARKLPVNIYRAKGVIYSSDAPARRAVLQVVGKRVELSLEDEWGARAPRTQIVVIGDAGGLDEAVLCDQFQKAVAPKQAVATTGTAFR